MVEQGHHIFTGEINSGKSTKLWDFYLDEKTNGSKISGWVSLPYFENGAKLGYDITFIIESRDLPKKPFIRTSLRAGDNTGLRWRKFIFDEACFEEVRRLDFGRPDIFVIDEVGPLELEDHGGFWPFLNGIFSSNNCTITVVRNNMIDKFLDAFRDYNFKNLKTLNGKVLPFFD